MYYIFRYNHAHIYEKKLNHRETKLVRDRMFTQVTKLRQSRKFSEIFIDEQIEKREKIAIY